MQLPSDNRTLAGYWEINGVKAHCLLDSRSEGVLLSLEFTRATGIKTFALEKPIALQLACIGSRSMINYGTHVTIKIGHKVVEEYFDIANVEHYNGILGTPFLRKMGIVLDFRSPGMAQIGNEVIPTGKVFFNESKDTKNNIATKGNTYYTEQQRCPGQGLKPGGWTTGGPTQKFPLLQQGEVFSSQDENAGKEQYTPEGY